MTVIPFPGATSALTPPAFDDATDEFLDDLRLMGRSKRTVKGHAAELRRLGRWIEEEHLDWQGLTPRPIKRFCRPRAHKSHSTRSNLFCSLRMFFNWCVEEGYYGVSPVQGATFKTPKRARPLPKALTREQVRTLITHLASMDRPAARRDEALILLALYTGLRALELATLRWSQVDLDAGVVNIPLSKMNKGRAIPLHAVVVTVLRDWKAIQKADATGPVFGSLEKKSRPITAGRVGKIVRRIAHEAGLEFTAHILRHTFATWALRQSHDLYGVSKSLGHAELRQTEIYVSADTEELRNAVDSLFPLTEW